MAKDKQAKPPAGDPYEIEDLWLNAIAEFPDDLKPLAVLLRSDTPMPPAVRDLLAEYLAPGEPDITGGKLVYEPTDGLERVVSVSRREKEIDVPWHLSWHGWLAVAVRYHERRRKGDTSQEAADADPDVSDRTVYRYLDYLEHFIARLRGA